jgi:hypothetical protein
LTFEIRELLLDQALNSYFQTWKECYARGQEQNLHCNPDWISEHFKHSGNAVFNLDELDFSEPPWCPPRPTSKENVRIYFLDNGEEVVSAVPYVLDQRQLICGLGDLKLVKFPLRVMCLQSRINVPAETAAYDTLIERIVKANPDAVYANKIRTDSFFWKYLQSSPLIERLFKFYRRTEPTPHLLIRLEGTFENYMNKFTAKTRKNRFREIRLLEKYGSLQLTGVTRASEIEDFLKVAFEISKRTWQFDRGWGLRDPEMVRSKMQFLAQHGCLRSYVLKCGDTPCAFILGHQYGSRFYTEFAGADYQWRNQSVGSVILLLVLQDLFQENTPEFYDFGSYAAWQEYYATESYPESCGWLFRRRPYPLVTSSIYRTCSAVSMRTGALLQRYRLKSRIRRLLRPRARPALGLPQRRNECK